MTVRLRAGIVGPGGVGALHADALRRCGIELAGVAASSHAAASRHADQLGATTAYVDACELVAASDIDVVHICTPNHLHVTLARAALEAGKHVVCEKPLATSGAEARAALAAAQQGETVAAVAYNHRYYPMVRRMRALVEAGDLGRLHLVHGGFLLEEVLGMNSEHWMLDPGLAGPSLSLADVGVHWWDLVEYVTGMKTTDVLCTKQVVRPGSHASSEDSAAVLLRGGGVVASAVISQAAPGHGNTLWIEVVGDRASARWDIGQPDILLIRQLGRAARTLERGRDSEPLAPPARSIARGQVEGHADAFRDFIGAVYRAAGGAHEAPYPTFADGVRGIEILEAALLSAAENRWVSVSSQATEEDVAAVREQALLIGR